MDEFLSTVTRSLIRLLGVCVGGLFLLALAGWALISVVRELGFALITPGGLVLVVLVWCLFGRRRQKS